ncbi:protein disulfide-isomerase TMX3-like%2C partial, partial [Scomber scombrus]
SLYLEAPLIGCFLLCLPLGVVLLVCYACCSVRSTTGDEVRGQDQDEDEDDDSVALSALRRRKLTDKKSD